MDSNKRAIKASSMPKTSAKKGDRAVAPIDNDTIIRDAARTSHENYENGWDWKGVYHFKGAKCTVKGFEVPNGRGFRFIWLARYNGGHGQKTSALYKVFTQKKANSDLLFHSSCDKNGNIMADKHESNEGKGIKYSELKSIVSK